MGDADSYVVVELLNHIPISTAVRNRDGGKCANQIDQFKMLT